METRLPDRRTMLQLAGLFLLGSAPACAQLRPGDLRRRKGFQWRTAKSESFDYYFEGDSTAEHEMETIQRVMEKSRVHNLQLVGAKSVPFRVTIFLVESRERMKALSGREMNGWANGQMLAAVYGGTIKAVGCHEDCHLVSMSVWGRNPESWLNEGLAVYADDQWHGYRLHELCKYLAGQQKLIALPGLLEKGGMRQYSDMVTYPQVGSLVKYLYEKYGMEAVRAIWRGGAGQMARVFGHTPVELEQEWLARIAESDASGIRYQAN